VIRVFIVAASPLTRAGLESLLADRNVEVLGSVANVESLNRQWSDSAADIVVVEASGDQLKEALDFLAEAEFTSEASVVVLSDHSEPRLLAEALRAGIRAVLPSNISSRQLVAALEAATAGLIVLDPAEVAAAFPAKETSSRPTIELTEPLTSRESEVFQMVASGLANKEIAARLAISEHTVKFHVASILGKLGAGSRTEAVALGIRRGLVLL